MAIYQILDEVEIEEFETPPKFNSIQRKKFLRLTAKVRTVNEGLTSPLNQICFSLMFGYFKAIHKFFTPESFHFQDIEYMSHQLEIPEVVLDFESIHRQTLYRYRKVILEHFQCSPFEKRRDEVTEYVEFIVSKQSPSRQSFDALIDFLRQHRIEIPRYPKLNSILAQAFNDHDKQVIGSLKQNMELKQKELLESLFNQDHTAYSWHKLTRLKVINQSVKPKKIRLHVTDTLYLREMYNQIKPLLTHLNLSPNLIEHYASWVKKSQVSQVNQKDTFKRYLHILCFVAYQYFSYQDALVDKFQRCVQKNLNDAQEAQKQWLLENQKEQARQTKSVIEHSLKQDDFMDKVYRIAIDESLSAEDKLTQILELFQTKTLKSTQAIKDIIEKSQQLSDKALKKTLYYQALESSSRKLQGRVSGILQILNFNPEHSETKIMKAISHYAEKTGMVTSASPQAFLSPDLKAHLKDDQGRFRTSLYKSLLFSSVSHGIKSGSINLSDTHKYKSFEEYLYPKELWEKDKNKLLKQVGLEAFVDCQSILNKYRQALYDQYQSTNDRIENEKNSHIRFDKKGKYILQTPPVERPENTELSAFFPQSKYIALPDILSIIQNHCHYLSSFVHHSPKYTSTKPDPSTFYAGIMGYGCQLGIQLMAQISQGVDENELENTANWYFSNDNLKRANNKVLQFIQTLELPECFRKSPDSLHTSSDGQKYQVPKESLNANYSFKYFGKGRGVSVYSFIDERHLLFHSEVISSSEREAAWVIDGLMHNDVIKSDIHSTDTHGYSEIIFGVMHLLGYVFAPRIKNLKKQQLYTFPEDTIGYYKQQGYQVIPDRYIQVDLIEKYWDDILRFIVTIKLKHTTASQLI